MNWPNTELDDSYSCRFGHLLTLVTTVTSETSLIKISWHFPFKFPLMNERNLFCRATREGLNLVEESLVR